MNWVKWNLFNISLRQKYNERHMGESKVFWTWNLPWLGFQKVDEVGLNAYSREEIFNGGVLNMKIRNRLLVAYINPMWNASLQLGNLSEP
jgi:hypothetical protein